MTGAINYVRREGRYVMKYCYFNMAAPIGLSTVMSNMGESEFYHLLFTPFADMALFFLNRKKAAM